MDINQLLKGKKCSCGRFHTCDIGHVFIEDGAISKLSELCREYKSVLVVADENTFAAAGDETCRALDGKISGKVIFDGKKILIPNEESIERVTAELGGTDLIVGIGSGVVQDLCKYVSSVKSIPYIIVATKCDKLNKTEREQRRKAFSENPYLKAAQSVIEASAQNGEGMKELKEVIEKSIEA